MPSFWWRWRRAEEKVRGHSGSLSLGEVKQCHVQQWALVGVEGKEKREGNGKKKGRIGIKKKDERKNKEEKEGRQAGKEEEKKEKRRPGLWVTKWILQSGSCDPWTWRPLPHAEMLHGALVLLTFPSACYQLEHEGHVISPCIPQCLPCCWVSNDLKN